ncbi:MAG: hypothetical protein U9O86_03010 [Campylobacterota bacterium]|nr:hypothetical protein [Campylobacterota bacterium]
MSNFIKTITVLLLVSVNLFAMQDREFYLIAKEERLGSLSSHSKESQGVYLRWDVLDGEFPSDIATLELIREDASGDKRLLSVDAQTRMSSSAISKMFQNKEAQRDLYRVIEQMSHSTDESCSGVNITNIGEKVSSCLESEFWKLTTTKSNFHVAMANHRAFLDKTYDATLSSVTYKLIGKDITATKSRVLGRVEVNVGVQTDALAAVEFQQVVDSTCNDNRYALDDYRVGLSWKKGGANANEAFVNSLMMSGYDLYYSTKEYSDADTPAADIDIKALAQNEVHSATGEISLLSHKLQKANEAMLLQAPYYETMEQLKSRGFKPGETRYYFLVAKDFTGNYGKTAYAEVLIPDLLPPPAPSNIFVFEEDTSDESINVNYEAVLKFDTVSFKNYIEFHSDMKVCSTETITPNSRVHFAPKGESCDSPKLRTVNFNVSEYYVYRFDNSAEAAGFEDLDLDGYNDADELDSQRCDALSFPSGVKNYLATTIAQTQESSVRFADSEITRAKSYWYRVVSVTPSGVVSHMSAPIEAFISKRESFALPKVNATYKEMRISKENKGSITEVVAQDTLGLADRVRLEFSEGSFDLPLKAGLASLTAELREKLFTARPSGSIKLSFMKDISVVMSKYIDANELFIYSGVYEEKEPSEPVEPGGFQLPMLPSEASKLLGYKISTVPKFMKLYESIETLVSGDSVPGGCVELNFDEEFINEYKEKACLQTSLKIGQGRYPLEKDCSLELTKEICNETLNSEMVSVGVKFVMDSGAQTPETFVNYVVLSLDDKVPYTPVLKEFALDKTTNGVSVKLQPLLEKVSGSMVEFYKQNSDESYVEMVELLSSKAAGNPLLVEMSEAILNEGETWCVRAKTIGINNQLSPWSEPICSDVKSDKESIDSLSWPRVQNRVKRVIRPLEAAFNPLFKQVEIRLATQDISGTADVRFERLEQEYSDIIARDYVLSSAKSLEIKMYEEGKSPLDKTLIKTLNIEKFFDYFILPKSAVSSADVSKINSLVLSFKDKDSLQVGDSVSIKKSGILSYTDSKVTLSTNALVEIRSELTNRECILTPLIDKYTNYVVYRQELSTTPGGVAGNFVQVSPLVERSTCTKAGYKFNNNLISYTINDTSRVVKYVDRYPYEIGKRYRYMFLFFDEHGEPRSYSLTTPESVETN